MHIGPVHAFGYAKLCKKALAEHGGICGAGRKIMTRVVAAQRCWESVGYNPYITVYFMLVIARGLWLRHVKANSTRF